MRSTLVAVVAALTLSGCGEQSGGERLLGTVTSVLPAFLASADVGDARGVPAGFTPEAIAENPRNYVLVTIAALGITEPARLVASNGRDETFVSQSGFTAAFRDGVLVATRGLLHDLHSADAPDLRAALRAGGGAHRRQSESLDAFDAIVPASYDCIVTRGEMEDINLGVRTQRLQRFDERCQGSGVIFENLYWVDGSGEIVASRQYVSPTVAYLRSNRL
ncbi:MAG: YjbF family lipoprotein [Rubellimicrobium sp.]|nr:YjbF family lipoprotein [Rubellimicrobium sp.]